MPLIRGPLRFTVGVLFVSVTSATYANAMARAIEKCKNLSPFGNRLKVLMEERRLTQLQVANAVGISRAAVGTWLQGTVPGAGEVFKLARAFNKPMEWFFESIPYDPEPSNLDFTQGPMEIPLDRVSPELRPLYAAMADELSTPAGKAAFLERLHKHFAGVASVLPEAPKKSSTQVLTAVRGYANLATMTSPLANLIDRLKTATATKGMKAELADFLHVPRSCVSDWLSARRQPGGETTLKLLHWVEQQEAQQKQSPGSVQPPPGRKTQSKVPNEKKPKSSPLKE